MSALNFKKIITNDTNMAKTPSIHTDESMAAETVVGHSVKIQGDLVSEGDIKVDGVVAGKVRTSKNLFVGPTAKVEADVQAGSSTVAGIIAGNVKVNGLLNIMQTGRISGDIECEQLAVEEGAYFSGNCKMKERSEGKFQKQPVSDEE